MGTTGRPKIVAVLEAVTAGFLSGDDSDGGVEQDLVSEGAAMLAAVCESVLGAGGTVETIVDPRFRTRCGLPASVVAHDVQDYVTGSGSAGSRGYYGTNWPVARRGVEAWSSIAGRADTSVVVAPEGDGLLGFIVESLEAIEHKSFNCSAPFIRFASDKWQVAEYCHQRGIAHPPTWLLSEWVVESRVKATSGGWCIKPRDGVGCVGLLRVDDVAALAALSASGTFRPNDRWIVQRWVEGVPVSRGYIADGRTIHPAAWMRQEFDCQRDATTGGNAYAFARGSILEDLPQGHSPTIERQLLAGLIRDYGSQLKGWFGIDYVLEPGGQLTLMEINPRLTTTFSAKGNEPSRRTFGQLLLRGRT